MSGAAPVADQVPGTGWVHKDVDLYMLERGGK